MNDLLDELARTPGWPNLAQAAADEITRLRAEMAEAEARGYRRGLEDAAASLDAEADKCDDAARWGGTRKYIADCKAASYAMRNRAAAIRALGDKP